MNTWEKEAECSSEVVIRHGYYHPLSPGLVMDRGLNPVLQTGPSRIGSRLSADPAFAGYSLAVRRPVLSRYPASAGPPPFEVCCQGPRCDNATPFASIRLGQGLALDKATGAQNAPIRHRAVPGTQQINSLDQKRLFYFLLLARGWQVISNEPRGFKVIIKDLI